MRVVLLCPYALDVPGGVQGQVMGLAGELSEMSIDVRVLAPASGSGGNATRHTTAERSGKVPDESSSELICNLEDSNMLRRGTIGIVGKSIPLRANGSVAPVDLSPVSWMRGIHSIGQGGYDLVHIHEPFAPGIGYMCMLKCRLPMVGTFHRAGAGFSYRLLSPLARYGASRIDRLCAVSYEAAKTACVALGEGYLPDNKDSRSIEVLWNGIDTRRFTGTRSILDSTSPVIIFVGRHEKRKGLQVLLEAFRDISGLPEKPLLWVVGEGPETAMLQSMYGDDPGVIWLGVLRDEELADKIAAADILCAPSLGGESFGMVPLEAMAASTLIVASDIPGYRAVIGDYGILVPPGNARLLSEGLMLGLDAVKNGKPPASPEDLNRAKIHASEYSMHALAASYAEIYENVVSLSER